ncbi:MAG TPA: ATP-binding protein, partial [Ramlibacter sp.]|nr:ATP-binding protein [Ramlibacter sp.]
ITDGKGTVLGSVMVLVDRRDRAVAEGRVETLKQEVRQLLVEKQRTESLSAEIEAFAAAVSHDLRTPLSAITGFSELLSLKHREALGDSGKYFLDRVSDNARYMSRMVGDYAAYMNTSRQSSLELRMVDIEGLAAATIADLTAGATGRSTSFDCGPLPQAWCDEGQVRQVMVNLLDNAQKYSGKREQPQIELGATAGEEFHTFYVRDNGVGLDLAKASRLFEPFKRFHRTSEFCGTGVGLAVVKRIVERHGGRVWAESRPDAGATFFFTLPARPEAGPAAT